MGSRSQGSRPRIQKNLRPRPRRHIPATDPLEAKDRNTLGLGQGPRTQRGSVLQKKKKKVFAQNSGKFSTTNRQSQKTKVLGSKIRKFFTKFKRSPKTRRALRQNSNAHCLGSFSTSQKIVLSSRKGHFRGLAGFKAKDLNFEAKDFKLCPIGRSRGHGRPPKLLPMVKRVIIK